MGLKRHVMRRSSGELFGLISRDVRTAVIAGEKSDWLDTEIAATFHKTNFRRTWEWQIGLILNTAHT